MSSPSPQYWLCVKFPYVRMSFLRAAYSKHKNLYAPTFVHLMTLQNSNSIPPASKKRVPTRPPTKAPSVKSAEFDREFNWCADWQPGKSGEIEYILEDDPSGQQGPQNEEAQSMEGRTEEETPGSEECESGEGIECGCCCSEYIAVSRAVVAPQIRLD